MIAKNQRYLIAIDLDGTLLTDDKRITAKTKAYLQKLDKLGHIIVLASGRAERSTSRFAALLNLKNPVVSYNGVLTLSDHDENFKTRMATYPLENIKAIIRSIGIDNLENIMCETPECVWLQKEDKQLSAFFDHNEVKVIYGDILQNLDVSPITLIFKFKEHTEEMKNQARKIIRQYPNYDVRFWWDSDYGEIFYQNVTKADGIASIAEYYKIPSERIIAFGDAENDIHMLSRAHYGFAMKNANLVTKKHAAYYTCRDNNHDGIIFELAKLLKIPID
ncbi:MAG: Cof-type HAD-IIB family hydrolase [Bacilli bacterium]